ncbi:MAG TPA: bifunctional DNA primase/polymerase [Acidimicrobiales bacterium]|nr:bifunctional DNA primase/polymerase [Acidimicrobiales bacterium]
MTTHPSLGESAPRAREPKAVEAALAYAKRGWAVFPCHHPVGGGCSCRSPECTSVAKHPRTRRGLRDASTHPEVIARWWRAWPHANVAIRTGSVPGAGVRGLVVVDIDPLHGGDASLERLLATHGSLPPTRAVHTGSGGKHLYFAHPGGSVRNSAGTRLGPGLDVRGDGGYVIAPPSVHASGAPYQWGPVRGLAPLPDWLCDHLLRPQHQPPPAPDTVQLRRDAGVSAWAAAAVDGELARVAGAQLGQRNHVLNRAAFVLGQIVGGGHLERDMVAGLLEQAGQCAGLGARETAATVESGMAAGEAVPRHPPDRPPPSPGRATPAAPEVDAIGVDLRNIELPARHVAVQETSAGAEPAMRVLRAP